METIAIDGVTYYIQNGEAIAIGVTDTTITEVIVPSTVNGYSVTGLRETFKNCNSLLSVTLPSSLKTIGLNTFYNCSKLTNITIPNGVTSLGEYSFYNCTSLENIEIPNTVTSMGSNVFRYCSKLKNVTIPNSVTNMGSYAFASCTNLTNITISNCIKIISSLAFKGCTRLTSVIIPDSIEQIDGGAFEGCSNLISVSFSSNLKKIFDNAFYGCYGLVSIEIPEGVTIIGTFAFASCKNLTNITLPSSLITICDGAFRLCTSLENIVIPQGVKNISNGNYYAVFSDCINLKTAIIPSSVEKMRKSDFPSTTILLVEENSYAHTFDVNNNLLYFILHKVENPEIAYGSAIEGTVTNSDGTVASGVTVEIYYEDGTLKESVTTDANGKYAFTYAEVGKYTIKAYNSYGNTASTVVYVKRMNVFDVFLSGDTSITLKTSYTVSGSVSENATVKPTDLNGNVISTVIGDGFTFTNVANGTYLVVAESENGSASQEITVFNSNVTDINLEINTDTAKIWGYVEVEDRDNNKHRRHWVEVSVYNEQGNVIATQKSDKDGKYFFENLPFGDYSIVAKTTEMRPDKKHGYDRSHELYGYAYISITESGTYEVDTIVLYEENDYTTTVSGKANINKDKSKSCEFIMYNAFGVEYAKVTSENGKYSFKNVKDGLYIIMALTENDGMGFTVIVVRNGKIHGNTNINIVKADKIKDREDKFENEIPDFESKEQAEQYRQRIADEKRFYDSLSEKEKKQLSKKYIQRLNKYIEWLASCENNEGVENSGLVISGDEIGKGDDISFTITVEKQEKWEDNKNGIETSNDFIHHNMKDKAGKGEIVEYYEISMTKTSNGSDKVITSVYKDTDAMGKFRVTLEIPEEYKGMKHYSLVHVHCGEVTVLTDLDDNPDTITVEIDKFSTFALATTDEDLVDEAVSTVTIDDIIKFKGYSVGPDGTSMCVGFDIDMDALEAYEKKTGKTIDFGAVFTSYDRLNGKAPLDAITGEKITVEGAKVIKASLKEYSYTTYDFVLTNITDDIANHNFVIAGYIYDGENVLYIQSDTLSSTVIGFNLNQIKALTQ